MPADLPPQACIELQIKRNASGFAIGDKVRAGASDARVVSFDCSGYRPAAWLLIEDKLGHLVRVPLAELVKRTASE